jgi:hypothetical protein
MDTKERVEKLMIQKLQIEARLSNARAQLSKQDRRDEARRKIIAGAWLLKINSGDWRQVGEKLREAGMLDVRDEGLFGLDISRSVRAQSDAVPPAVL